MPTSTDAASLSVLMAAAELSPIARVGGMAEAVAGLVRQLRRDGLDVTVAVPDYGDVELDDEEVHNLNVPPWAGPVTVRLGVLPEGDGTPLALIGATGMAKPHPYNDDAGQAFPDNDFRFFAFSVGVAALAEVTEPDVLHLNDWHSAAAIAWTDPAVATVLTIHTLGYQGVTDSGWLERLYRAPELFAWYGGTNPLLGAIRLADRVVTVSPNYAKEILTEEDGMGLHRHLANRGDDLVGIINGIDTDEWNPATDATLPANYSRESPGQKAKNRSALIEAFSLDGGPGAREPIIGIVTRLVDQKGIDLVIDAARFLEHVPAKLVVLGSGDAGLANGLRFLAERYPGRIGFSDGYNAALSHLIFAGADLLAMPSRFEPCGLAQMQAMTYGTIPITTAVGGLRDTVIDADRDSERGTGFVSESVDTAGLIDAIHRGAKAWRSPKRLAAIRDRIMAIDWSWAGPAKDYEALYEAVVAAKRPT